NDNFESFATDFKKASNEAGKPKQYLVPYYIASHPGSDLHAMIDLALFLKRNGYRPDQVQDFIPAPFDVATCMFYTGIDPFTKQKVYVAEHLRDRKLQRALMENGVIPKQIRLRLRRAKPCRDCRNVSGCA